MSNLYIPDLSTDEFGPFVQGLASNFNLLEGSRIVEQGENENGEYWRWENGLQVCMGSVTVNFGVGRDEQYHLFPASFFEVFATPFAPSQTGNFSFDAAVLVFVSSSGNRWILRVAGRTGLPSNFTNMIGSNTWKLTAIGRWK